MLATYINRDIGQEYQFNNNEILLSFFNADGGSVSFPMTIKPKLLDAFIQTLKENGFKKEMI